MKTKTIRIAVEMTPDGDWQACAHHLDGDDWQESMQAFETPLGGARYWIEAEVPVPEMIPVVVPGKAVQAEEMLDAVEAA